MLRDWLCSIDGMETWPCDEINAVWRHGNLNFPSDQFTPDMVSASIRRYIRSRFAWVERHYKAETVVEKTCANSLRVAFVDDVLENPRYVFIQRDGVDATASAMKRWSASLDLPYVLKKARFVPLSDLPVYATRFLRNRLARSSNPQHRVRSWGPVVPHMAQLLERHSLAEVCAIQWRDCVLRAHEQFNDIPSERVLRLRYEDVVRDRESAASRLAEFLHIPGETLRASSVFDAISPRSIGRGRGELSGEDLSSVESIVNPTMMQLG